MSGTLLGFAWKVLTKSEEKTEALLSGFTAMCKQLYMPLMAYVRDDLSLQKIQLNSHLREKRAMWNMEVGLKHFVVKDFQNIDKPAMSLT